MTRKFFWVGGLVVALGSGVVVAQDMQRDKPLIDNNQKKDGVFDKAKAGAPENKTTGDKIGGFDRKAQCESALHAKDYLKDCTLTCRDDGGKIFVQGQVPSKVHACAVFLTCMSIEGVNVVDLSGLKVCDTCGAGSFEGSRVGEIPSGVKKDDLGNRGELGNRGVPGNRGIVDRDKTTVQPNPLTPGTDVKGGLAKDDSGKKFGSGIDLKGEIPNHLRLMAVVVNENPGMGSTTAPAGARRFQNDVILIDDSCCGKSVGNRSHSLAPDYNKDSLNKDNLNKDQLNKDNLNKDNLNKDNLNKGDLKDQNNNDQLYKNNDRR